MQEVSNGSSRIILPKPRSFALKRREARLAAKAQGTLLLFEEDHFSKVTTPLLIKIFELLNNEEQRIISQVCRRFHTVIGNIQFQKSLKKKKEILKCQTQFRQNFTAAASSSSSSSKVMNTLKRQGTPLFNAKLDLFSLSDQQARMIVVPKLKRTLSNHKVIENRRNKSIIDDGHSDRQRHLFTHIVGEQGELYSYWRGVLHRTRNFPTLGLFGALRQLLSYTVIFLCSGGHAAGGVFINGKCVAHACRSSYIVRKKAGRRQSARDNSGAGRPRSIGAQMRRANEVKYREKIQTLLQSWSEHFIAANSVWLAAPGAINKQDFFSAHVIEKSNPKLFSVPFTTERAKFKEVQRVFHELSNIRIDQYKERRGSI